MNLRDKLRLVASQPKPQPAQPTFTDCWTKEELRPLTDFPGAFGLQRDTLTLMQGEIDPPLPEPLDPRRILYLDTETTGLAGAGTVAFLVGLGWLAEDGFHVQQLMIRDYPEERFLLQHLAETARRFDAVCSFNGRTFDVPLLRDRFLMNRIRTDCLDLPHIDLLFIARRVWKLRLKRCNLGHLEEEILGAPRQDDIPGAEVPQRFFSYLKTGDFRLLEDVLTHNAQDIASLCTLLCHMTHIYEHPEQQLHMEDLFSMGAALEKYHHNEEARHCWELVDSGAMRAQGQLRLAQSWRREGQREEAVAIWQQMVQRHEGGVEPLIELAKYCEHVAKDIPRAMEYTRRAISLMAEPTLTESDAVQRTRNALQYRYDRLKRKLDNKGVD
ncbi:MAG: ribonuclease H-like domain-containing protein [Clostridia bacterium]|nr:ribonuclease H-like domain-containing protein [Clostridia bacterium]